MRLKVSMPPAFARAMQIFAIVRDLLGSAALGSTLALLVFVIWLVLQFGQSPNLEQLAQAAQKVMWIIAGVYAALWIVRTLNAQAPRSHVGARPRLNVGPLVRSSGNAVVVVGLAWAIAQTVPGLVNSSWLIVAGYPTATLGFLLTAAFGRAFTA